MSHSWDNVTRDLNKMLMALNECAQDFRSLALFYKEYLKTFEKSGSQDTVTKMGDGGTTGGPDTRCLKCGWKGQATTFTTLAKEEKDAESGSQRCEC